jgi:hypothetical protein
LLANLGKQALLPPPMSILDLDNENKLETGTSDLRNFPNLEDEIGKHGLVNSLALRVDLKAMGGRE